MSWGYVAVAAATVVAGAMSNNASKKGAAAQKQASQNATQESARQFDITQENLKPWLVAGQDALSLQQRYLNGDQSAFTASPDYAFRLDQGQRSLEGSASSRGNLFGGGTQTDLINYGQGMASSELNNWWNRLAGVAGTGQTTGTQLGNFGQNYATQAGNNAMNAANATASSYNQQAQNNGQTVGQLAQLFGQWKGNQNTNIASGS